MRWHDLFVALALVFVFEGVLPFLKPHHCRKLLANFVGMSDQTLRFVGLSSMICGVLLLYAVR